MGTNKFRKEKDRLKKERLKHRRLNPLPVEENKNYVEYKTEKLPRKLKKRIQMLCYHYVTEFFIY